VSIDPSEIGAFLSGIAAVISAIIGSKVARRRAKSDCEQRIEEVKRAMHEGFHMKDEEGEKEE